MERIIHTEAEMLALGREIAADIVPGDCITLRGTLGAGKTVLARGIIQALSSDPVEVTSPTFTLVQEYPVTLKDGFQQVLWHVDLYRLEQADDIEEIGLEEVFGEHITLIEWPEIIAVYLPSTRTDIYINLDEDNTRSVTTTHFTD
jgi:tRNA threonylcarbamoyladenosine biosynthesis protein TsaE